MADSLVILFGKIERRRKYIISDIQKGTMSLLETTRKADAGPHEDGEQA
jgi:hypothetical protein